MRYGHFDDKRKEYVIDRPDTPRSWTNYLGSTVYGAIITNNAGGYSFYQSTARGRLTRLVFNNVPMDQPGRYFYLRDEDSGDFWSTSWQPVGKSLDEYKTVCRHGTGYTVIESDYSEIHTESAYFVPHGKKYECWILRVTNTGSRERTLGATAYAEFTNDLNIAQDTGNLQYTQYLVDCTYRDNCIDHGYNTHLAESSLLPLNAGGARHRFLAMTGAMVEGFDTDREAFIGPYRSYSNPIAVEMGACSDSLAHGDNGCGALQTTLVLKPGETVEFCVLLGMGQGEVQGREAMAEIPDAPAAWRALDEVRSYWHDRIGAYISYTPDKALDSMVNVWNAYNALITFAWSRSASLVYCGERDGLGYRDTVQDILGVLAAIPEDAGKRLELMITGQYSHGGAMPVVRPFEHTPGNERVIPLEEHRADDCLWLFNTVPAYVKETGDLDFYNKVLPYADQGEASVYEHLWMAIEFNWQNRGEHGLPCGLLADWNDALVLGAHGESLFVAFQLRYALTTIREIAPLLERSDDVLKADQRLEELDQVIEAHGWDGEWFVRAYSESGDVYGSRKNQEGSIWLNAQSWAVISAAGTPEQTLSAMDAVGERLATEYGIALCDPPYRNTPIGEIRAVLYNPSMKENGGIFCHPQSWAVIAETILGRGNKAYEYLRAYLPSAYNDKAEVRQIEPYVHAQSTHGKHSRRFGASRLPWLSGTASWTYYTMTQFILGIRPDYDGLRVDPCIPEDWPGFEVNRRFRGKNIHITVTNPDGLQKGISQLVVNGETIEGNLIPMSLLRDDNIVEVIIDGAGLAADIHAVAPEPLGGSDKENRVKGWML